MRVLIVKTSSMGDIIHTLPSLSDAAQAISGISFDWVVEETFAEIPAWHKQVNKVIPVAWRRWRKDILRASYSGEIQNFLRVLRAEHYDRVIDTQGLIKSAVITRFSRGLRCGLDFSSAWERLASLAYQRRLSVAPKQHAISRMRQLLSKALDYPLPQGLPDYGIMKEQLPQSPYTMPYLVFLHATTWITKHWPIEYWIALAKLVNQAGYKILLPWGEPAEQQQASKIAEEAQNAEVLPKQSLRQLAAILANSQGIIGIDTGLTHLAVAMDIPLVSLYGPTDPALTGVIGKKQLALAAQFPCAPCLQKQCAYEKISQHFPACFTSLQPEHVWKMLQKLLTQD